MWNSPMMLKSMEICTTTLRSQDTFRNYPVKRIKFSQELFSLLLLNHNLLSATRERGHYHHYALSVAFLSPLRRHKFLYLSIPHHTAVSMPLILNHTAASSPLILRHTAAASSPILCHTAASSPLILRHNAASSSPILRHTAASYSPILWHTAASSPLILRHTAASSSPILRYSAAFSSLIVRQTAASQSILYHKLSVHVSFNDQWFGTNAIMQMRPSLYGIASVQSGGVALLSFKINCALIN